MRAIEKRLREKVKSLEAELAEVKLDRERFRHDAAANLRDAIKIQGDGSTYNMAYLIEKLAKQMQNKVKWYW